MQETYQVPDELLARCVGRVDLVQRVLSSFLTQLEADIPQLMEDIRTGIADDVRKTAHRIKGASANVSAVEIRRNVATVELLAETNRLDEVEPELAKLQSDWNSFKNSTATFISG